MQVFLIYIVPHLCLLYYTSLPLWTYSYLTKPAPLSQCHLTQGTRWGHPYPLDTYGKVQIRIQYTGAEMFQIIFEILVQIIIKVIYFPKIRGGNETLLKISG